MFKKISIFILILISIVILYYTITVLIFRAKTDTIVENAFNKYGKELSIENLSDEQLNILLTIEDPNFFNHNGVDLKTNGAGITTITQGLVKYLYFKNFKQGIAKIKQSLLATYALDAKVSKNEQLNLFLNSAYFGNDGDTQIRGYHEASKYYIDKEFSELTKDDFILLTSMLIGPNQFNPKTNNEKLQNRIKRINNLLEGKCKAENNRDVYYNNCDINEK